MARVLDRRPQNVPGEFYVDRTCIDCDTCRWMAPRVFARVEEQSAVIHQPQHPQERLAALQALLACPTQSIGTLTPPSDIRQVQASFPIPIAGPVFHCGYHARASFGASSYLIRDPDGNILVDSPRFAAPLVKTLEAWGGVRYLFLTHQDDVADHEKFHDHFGCVRILHQADLTPETEGVEWVLTGRDPVPLGEQGLMIPVPGHTPGHTVLLYARTYLFSGDHLAWSPRLGHLYAFRGACWYSWSELMASMRQLAGYSFTWVLPGHGRRFHGDPEVMGEQLRQCLAWMETVA
ncbi:MAG: MBL fold metallo-hydrolase [Thermostichales cyanobacterium BF4_bins_65]